VYVIGDNANTPYTGLAQTAISDADFVATDIKRRLDKRLRLSYKPRRPIAVTPVGQRWAVAEWGSLHLYGYLGWWLRRAGDLVAYHDIESWPRALRVWLQDSRREDDCTICQTDTNKE
jgi:NADH dehydrogenase FAD-containing subunit